MNKSNFWAILFIILIIVSLLFSPACKRGDSIEIRMEDGVTVVYNPENPAPTTPACRPGSLLERICHWREKQKVKPPCCSNQLLWMRMKRVRFMFLTGRQARLKSLTLRVIF